jgi:hypothetical protein
MSAGGPVRAEIPPDTRPSALVLGGLRRGALLVFLPVLLAGQALAWLTYAASGWYHPWSWFKIGLAETLASVRVPFVSTGLDPVEQASLQVAFGALTIAVLVLAYRAGREQARGLERTPLRAAIAGSLVGPGFALPMLLAALPVTLGFPQFGIDRLRPVLWQSLLLPLAVGMIAGALGGIARSARTLERAPTWTRRGLTAARGGALAFWWGVVLSFAGFLVLAAVSPGPTDAYARFVDRTGGSGAATLIQHAVLLPNQSALFLTMAMGGTTTLSVRGVEAVKVDRSGIAAVGEVGGFLAAYSGAADNRADFPSWFTVFWLIPLAATLLGGLAAGVGQGAWPERSLRGVLAGCVYTVACTVAAWAATLVVPAWADAIGGSVELGPDLMTTFALALAWGVVGCTLGALVLPRFPRFAASAPR